MDATILDLGCGALNPFGMLFLALMLGARRGIAVDLDEIDNVPRAAKALAELAALLVIDPAAILGNYAITRERLLGNVASFDLARLRAGDQSGIDPTRLELRCESVYSLTLHDGEVDLVISNAFFEHVPWPEAAIAELARVTRKGGLGVHNIDTSDHRHYSDRGCHRLEFLTEIGNEPLIHGSNRLRPREFVSLFESHGFELIELVTGDEVELTPDLLHRLVEPFRSMPDEMLRPCQGLLVVRRRDLPE
jgi:SAM-dependent methyltransferase